MCQQAKSKIKIKNFAYAQVGPTYSLFPAESNFILSTFLYFIVSISKYNFHSFFIPILMAVSLCHFSLTLSTFHLSSKSSGFRHKAVPMFKKDLHAYKEREPSRICSTQTKAETQATTISIRVLRDRQHTTCLVGVLYTFISFSN